MSASKYAMFLGCLIPHRLPQMEAVARKVLNNLGIGLVEMPDASCCPDPVGIQAFDYGTWLILAARNLSIAEGLKLDVMTPCSGCYETLKVANTVLKGNAGLRESANRVLSGIGRKFNGGIEVRHLVEVLYKDVGPIKILKSVKRPLKGLRVAVHYGCHLLRPSEVMRFDDPERPVALDELVTAIGAESVSYARRMLCCGGGLRSIDSKVALAIVREKLVNVKRAGADCIVVVCPTCMLQYDMSQPLVQRAYSDDYSIPVFYYPELLDLAMGTKPGEMDFSFHRVNVAPIVDKIFSS